MRQFKLIEEKDGWRVVCGESKKGRVSFEVRGETFTELYHALDYIMEEVEGDE